jgi:tRNA(fMet)-specific endonuclease VapC
MARQLILDTNALIAYERATFDTTALDDDLAIAAITVAEFRVGIQLARTTARATERARVLAVILDLVTVLDYTERTAAEHGRTLVSLDARARLGGLPGVTALDPLSGHNG